MFSAEITTAQLTEARGWLKNITYKPGYRFSFHTNPFDDLRNPALPRFRIVLETTDAQYGEGKTPATINGQYTFEPKDLQNEETFLAKVSHFIMELEKHEHAEWFKYKGRNVKDPHPEMAAFKVISDANKSFLDQLSASYADWGKNLPSPDSLKSGDPFKARQDEVTGMRQKAKQYAEHLNDMKFYFPPNKKLRAGW